MKKDQWNQTDRQHFTDHNWLRSKKIPHKPKPAPHPNEWDQLQDDLEDDTNEHLA